MIIVEPESGEFPDGTADRQQLERELLDLAAASPLTQTIHTVLFHAPLPVDLPYVLKPYDNLGQSDTYTSLMVSTGTTRPARQAG